MVVLGIFIQIALGYSPLPAFGVARCARRSQLNRTTVHFKRANTWDLRRTLVPSFDSHQISIHIYPNQLDFLAKQIRV